MLISDIKANKIYNPLGKRKNNQKTIPILEWYANHLKKGALNITIATIISQ